jgi:hypothetical protein
MMKVRNVSLLLGAAVLLFAANIVPAVQMRKNLPGVPQNPHFTSTGLILYSQMDFASGNGAPDQEFEATYSQYDSEGADDFLVTGGPWVVCDFHTNGSGSGGSINLDVNFYPNVAGNPGPTPVPGCSYEDITDYTDAAGDLDANFSPCCSLDNGTYWVALDVRQDFVTDGQHFWSDRTVQSGSEARWRNPGGGFIGAGVDCPDWEPKASSCGVGAATAPDFLFELTAEKPATTATPAVGPFGMLMTVLALGGGSAYVLARRRRA